MCDQCNAKATSYGEVIPGWSLMRATQDGIRWKIGQWGLVWYNDPSFTWTSTPTPDPLFRIVDEAEQEAWFEDHPVGTPEYERTMASSPDDFQEALKVDPLIGYQLVVAATAKGYDPDASGDFHTWLFSLMGEHLQTAKGVIHGDGAE